MSTTSQLTIAPLRQWAHPHIPPTTPCPRCTKPISDHGWIDPTDTGPGNNPDGITVCPLPTNT